MQVNANIKKEIRLKEQLINCIKDNDMVTEIMRTVIKRFEIKK